MARDTKTQQSARERGVEVFPRRVGHRIITDRPATPAEAEAWDEEVRMIDRAREYRRRKRAEAKAAEEDRRDAR